MPVPFLDQHHRLLAEANLLIVQTRARIESQRQLVAMSDEDGPKARKANKALSRLEATLHGMIQARALLLKDLNHAAAGLFDEPEWLRSRAAKMRAFAADLNTRDAKQLVYRLARSYQELAKCAEDRLARRLQHLS